jgi:hypothetical protein
MVGLVYQRLSVFFMSLAALEKLLAPPSAEGLRLGALDARILTSVELSEGQHGATSRVA